MKNLAVIPARSGSKGFKDKNIKSFNGKPLLAYAIEAANKAKVFDEIFVSTDSEQYAEIAREYGASVPFLRSYELSTDTASSLHVIKDSLIKYKEMDKVFDTVALLQPTSPLRTYKDIIDGYNKLKEKNANSVVSICEVDHSPMWSNTLPENKSLDNFLNKNIVNKPRQSLPTYYRINGAIYILKVAYLMETNDIYKNNSYAIIMDKKSSIDIDTELDFRIAEYIMTQDL
ncbi:MAG: acylneuraminate cytidylyltransferase family protein [Clostridium sulfidigenes]|uniref:Acylneuraminate cytidylyltransferase family protein n=1 Tax=Clostridium sulfidigenes TaxID=318464 RepID=A0A927W6D5_9CLOT|nr:acylneuraminate cytidylyltransferase family protein [Clostridium sulfidigenes]